MAEPTKKTRTPRKRDVPAANTPAEPKAKAPAKKKPAARKKAETYDFLGGRPTKLTPELIGEAAAFIQGGAYATTVQRALGVSESAWYAWLDRGRAALTKAPSRLNATDVLCAEFVIRIDQADALGELKLGLGPAAGMLGWQGMAWMMERKWPDRWGRSRAEAPTGGSLDALVEAIGKARADG